jgi:hypothetical protein
MKTKLSNSILILVLLIVFFEVIPKAHGQSFIINTIAGNSTGGYSGDGGQATAAELNTPDGVAVDSVGDFYIADQLNNCIRKVSISGLITTFAGNGTTGYSGDGGQATAAEMANPFAVALDDSGNVYIVDGNNCVRKVNKSGIITTIAGNTNYGFSGDGGIATAAEFNAVFGVAVDKSGNVYFADYDNNRIRKVNTLGIISTIAGNGTQGHSGDGGQATVAELNDPIAVAVDDSGNVYTAEYGSNYIRKINTKGIIYSIAGTGGNGYTGDGGPATSAELNAPSGLVVNKYGTIYIADENNNAVRKVNSSGIISTIAGNGFPGYSGDGGPATSAELSTPWAVDIDKSGNIYINDEINNVIRELTVATGINQVSSINDIKVFPNPGNGVFNFQLGIRNYQSIGLQVYNIMGECIYTESGSSTSQIDLSNQPKGIYLYRFLSQQGELIQSGKLVIQ